MDSLIKVLSERFKEAVTALSHSDIRSNLNDALGNDGCVCDVFGDDDSGDVVYHDYKDGKTKKAPYEIGSKGKGASIDRDSASEVKPRTVYEEPPDEEGEMTEAHFLGLHERFISKSSRDAADSSDFAGNYEGSPNKKSFPILKAGDVQAAVHSIGRGVAGGHSGDKLKARIKAIAKRKGFASSLPDTMKPASEAAEVEIKGEFVALREGAVGQDGTAYLKLIAPGWGSSGHYSKELLKRDGPQVFKAGLKNYWNHPTAAEESARPEGDLRDVASVLQEDAHYEENGPAGAGLYAKAQVMPSYREHVDSLAKHIGMSIRAMGQAKEGQADGKKGTVIEKLTRAQSVDYVTEPGAGGKVLQLFEAARAATKLIEGDDMDEAQIKKLIESAVQAEVGPLKAENKKLLERLTIVTEAPRLLDEALKSVNLPPASAKRVRERCLAELPMKDGKLDDKAFGKLIEAQVKDEGEFLAELSGGRFVVGMGVGAAPSTDPKVIKEHEEKFQEEVEDTFKEMADLMVLRQPGTGDDKEDKKRRRKNFAEGRAA